MREPNAWRLVVAHSLITDRPMAAMNLLPSECRDIVAYILALNEQEREHGYQKGRDALAEALHDKPKSSGERRAFIRQAAIQLQFSTDEEGDPIVQASRAWEIARALWDAKPEDC